MYTSNYIIVSAGSGGDANVSHLFRKLCWNFKKIGVELYEEKKGKRSSKVAVRSHNKWGWLSPGRQL